MQRQHYDIFHLLTFQEITILASSAYKTDFRPQSRNTSLIKIKHWQRSRFQLVV